MVRFSVSAPGGHFSHRKLSTKHPEEECAPRRRRASLTRNHRGDCQRARSSKRIFSCSPHCPQGLSVVGQQTSSHTGVTRIPQSPYVQLKISGDTFEPKCWHRIEKFLPESVALCTTLLGKGATYLRSSLLRRVPGSVSRKENPSTSPPVLGGKVLVAGDPRLPPPPGCRHRLMEVVPQQRESEE